MSEPHVAQKSGPRPVPETVEIIGRKRYRTEGATCLAQQRSLGWWGWLMRTPKGNFFTVSAGLGVGRPGLKPLSADEAMTWYESAEFRLVEWEDAFGEPLEDA